MAAFVSTDAFVSINGVDLSAFVRSVTLNYSADLQEDTSMGDSTRTRIGGLKDWSVDVTFKQDFDSGSVDGTLFSLVGGSAVTIIVRPDKSDGVSTTNPNYTGSCILESYNPVDNAVGDLAEVSVTFQCAGALSRNTA